MILDLVDMNAWMGYLLVMVRMMGAMSLFPFLTWMGTPAMLRVGISVIMALLVFVSMGEELFYQGEMGLHAWAAIINEGLTGLTLGFLIYLFFSMFMWAGSMVDLKAALMMSGEFDPYLGSQVTIWGRFYYLMALVFYLMIDGHHHLFRGLTGSFHYIPLGTGLFVPEQAETVFEVFSQMFILAFQIGAPVILILMLIDISLGLIGKTVPQVHIFILGLPLKVVMSMFLLALLMPLLLGAFEGLMERFLDFYYTFIMEWT